MYRIPIRSASFTKGRHALHPPFAFNVVSASPSSILVVHQAHADAISRRSLEKWTHPVGPACRSLPSMMCMNFRWFRFPCFDDSFGCNPYSLSSPDPTPHPGGSITLSSSIQASSPRPPLDPAVGNHRFAHFGMIPLFNINLVVCSCPVSGLTVRERTSTDRTWRAKGLG